MADERCTTCEHLTELHDEPDEPGALVWCEGCDELCALSVGAP